MKSTDSNDSFARNERAYFNARHVDPVDAYVAWFDMMGAKDAFARSLIRAANFIAKMHDAVSRAAPRSGCDVVPITDGAFLITTSALVLRRTLDLAMFRLACTFMGEKVRRHRFLVRCGIAFGKVVPGRHLARGLLSTQDAAHGAYQAPLGIPISDAYAAESDAAPFGVFVHNSAARGWGLTQGGPWKWWDTGIIKPEEAGLLGRAVVGHLNSLKFERRDVAVEKTTNYFNLGGA